MPDDITLPTSVPHDDAGLRASAAAIRATLSTTDPSSMYYQKPEASAAAERNVQAMLLRAGVTERPVATAAQQAAAQWDASFRRRDMPGGLVELVNTRAAAVTDVKGASEALRQQLGEATYGELARPDLGGAAGDLHALKILANHGRYLAAYNRTRPGGNS